MSARSRQVPGPVAVQRAQNLKRGRRFRPLRQSKPLPVTQDLRGRKTKTSQEAQSIPAEAGDHPSTGAQRATGFPRHRIRPCEAALVPVQPVSFHLSDREAESRCISQKEARRANTPRSRPLPARTAGGKLGALRIQHLLDTAAANAPQRLPGLPQRRGAAAASSPAVAIPPSPPRMAKDLRHTQFESGRAAHRPSLWTQAVSLVEFASPLSFSPAPDLADIRRSSSKASDGDSPDE